MLLLGTNKVRVVGMSVMINYRDQLNLICLILKSSFFSNYEVFDIDYVRMSLETIGVKEVKNAREDGNCIKTSLIVVKWIDEISMVGSIVNLLGQSIIMSISLPRIYYTHYTATIYLYIVFSCLTSFTAYTAHISYNYGHNLCQKLPNVC